MPAVTYFLFFDVRCVLRAMGAAQPQYQNPCDAVLLRNRNGRVSRNKNAMGTVKARTSISGITRPKKMMYSAEMSRVLEEISRDVATLGKKRGGLVGYLPSPSTRKVPE